MLTFDRKYPAISDAAWHGEDSAALITTDRQNARFVRRIMNWKRDTTADP